REVPPLRDSPSVAAWCIAGKGASVFSARGAAPAARGAVRRAGPRRLRSRCQKQKAHSPVLSESESWLVLADGPLSPDIIGRIASRGLKKSIFPSCERTSVYHLAPHLIVIQRLHWVQVRGAQCGVEGADQ